MIDEDKHFVVTDIPPEWRMCTESIIIPQKPLPLHDHENTPTPVFLSDLIQNDLSFIPTSRTAIETLLEQTAELLRQMKECRKHLKTAELKRREIASSAELLSGVCNSQITEEQRLTVFVSGIDKFISFYENLDRIYIDFKSPGFTVLSPDFSSAVHKISEGIKFFSTNSNFRDSKLFKLKYVSLQNKAIELVSSHVTSTLERTVALSRSTDPYQKFQSIAPSIKRLFRLIEGMPRLIDALDVYKKIRIQIIRPQISFTSLDKTLTLTLELIQKEFELATLFFDFANETYSRCFSELCGELIDHFSNLYMHEVYATNDVMELCQFCSIFSGQKLKNQLALIGDLSSSTITTRQNLHANPNNTLNNNQSNSSINENAGMKTSLEIQKRLNSILITTQERIITQIRLISSEIARSQETVRYLLLLYNSLSRKQFCEPAFRLVSDNISYIEECGRDFNGSDIERNALMLSMYFNLKIEVDSIGRELDGDEIEFWNLLHPDNGYHLALMKRLESAITLRYQSLGSEITQFLMNPLFNLKARNIFSKPQLLSAIEGVSISIDTFFVDDIIPNLKKYITEQNQKDSLIHELKEQLILALGDCVSSFPDIDDETMGMISNLREKVLGLVL
ncbi:hypothetical protein TRFO_21676 [Tritrichomonas foetus]|uniref:Conserved oligomeric Golgi complex subunit 3 n=1 Tax=Tritrichomonas foetus TaxID=1144522 RepID=A0A1J4KI77_9EUKA|nr:hypothetical protein TRFO_21676 [Tritrichomonas foetus]|eukprot:OHT09374.1 hypothetical protein TRFO_21676 [Tritrichomonas foetus]